MQRKLVLFASGFTAAVLAIQYFGGNLGWLLFFGIVFVFILLYLIYKKKVQPALLLLCGVLFSLLWQSVYPNFRPIPQWIDGENVRFSATACDYSYLNSKKTGIVCKLNIYEINNQKLKRPVRTRLYLMQPDISLMPGDRISTSAQMELPKNSRDFSGFTYYKTRRIDAIAFASEKATLHITYDHGKKIRYFPAYLAYKAKYQIDAMVPHENEAGFMKAMLLGDRRGMFIESQEGLRTVGLSHVIAVSGMHVAFLATFIVLITGKRRAPVIAIPILFLFALMTGAGPSVIRAFIMQTIVLLAPMLRREADGRTSILFALLILLLINPYSVCDVGLQLSFLATLGLVLFSPRIDAYLMRFIHIKNIYLYKFIHFFISTFSATISATVFTLPLTAIVFHSVSVLSPIANVLLLWMISAIFVIAIVAVVVSFLSFGLGNIMMLPAFLMTKFMFFSTDKLSKIPFASIFVGNLYILAFIAYAYSIIYVVYKHRKRKKAPIIPICALAVALLATIAFTKIPATEFTGIRFSALDVGQGQSILAEYEGRRVLVDCGGSRDKNAGDIALDALKKQGSTTLDAVFLTHLHADHVNGVPVLMEKGHVHALYLPADTRNTQESRRLTDVAARRGTKVYYVDRNIKLSFGHMDVTVYYAGWIPNENELGLAVEIGKGDFEIFVTGDLGKKSEEHLLKNNQLPDVEVYVAGHHGSNTSSSLRFLNVIRPEVAVISVGAENQYGHPSPEVMDVLGRMGIHTRRTDELGTVSFYSDQIMMKQEK